MPQKRTAETSSDDQMKQCRSMLVITVAVAMLPSTRESVKAFLYRVIQALSKATASVSAQQHRIACQPLRKFGSVNCKPQRKSENTKFPQYLETAMFMSCESEWTYGIFSIPFLPFLWLKPRQISLSTPFYTSTKRVKTGCDYYLFSFQKILYNSGSFIFFVDFVMNFLLHTFTGIFRYPVHEFCQYCVDLGDRLSISGPRGYVCTGLVMQACLIANMGEM